MNLRTLTALQKRKLLTLLNPVLNLFGHRPFLLRQQLTESETDVPVVLIWEIVPKDGWRMEAPH